MDSLNDCEFKSEEFQELTPVKIVRVSKCSRIVDSSEEEDFPSNANSHSIVTEIKDDDEETNNESQTTNEETEKSNLRKKKIVRKSLLENSESDENLEKEISEQNSNNTCIGIAKRNINIPSKYEKTKHMDEKIYDAEASSDEDQIIDAKNNEESIKVTSSKKTDKKFFDEHIYDAEGSSDEGQIIDVKYNEESVEVTSKKKKDKKEKPKRNNMPRKSKQTAIEEIRSETQRLVRQSRISLPYHHPKERSLSEFLSRRKSLPVVHLKTSCDELNKVWEKIEEREKSAEMFYKSESDKSDSEISNNLINKLDSTKTVDHTHISEEMSLDLNLHYTETETQGVKETFEAKLQDGKRNNNEDKVEGSEKSLTSEVEGSEKSLTSEVEGTEFPKLSPNEGSCINSVQINIESTDSSEHCKFNFSENKGFGVLEKTITNKLVITKNQSSLTAEVTQKDISSGSLKNEDRSLVYKSDDLKTIELEIEDFINNTDNSEKINVSNRISRLSSDVLSNIILDKVPKLSGQPDEVIDLEKTPEKPGAVKLISRFMKHITLKPKTKFQENVVVAISEVNDNGEIVSLKEETIKINRKEETLKLKIADSSKPGETRMKLKETLKHKIAKSREQQFAKRMEEFKLYEEEICEEGKKSDYEEDIEEVNLTESESESEVEDDVELKDVIRTKNPFADEEAEESENDEEEEVKKDSDSEPEEYSDVASIDFGSLVDKDEEHPALGVDLESGNTQRNNELLELCSGGFASQPVNLDELEKNDLSFTQFDNGKSDSSPDNNMNENETIENNENSDDEILIKKKKKPKLTFSDDEDEEEQLKLNEEMTNDKEDSLCENSGNEEEEINLDEEETNEDDEEANEDEEAEYPDVSTRAAKRFLEAEAELSGSEWGSADEDELDLDFMEKEEGDDDVINQRKVRSELEKIHMKEILDEDKREIRALQELFLEDGELHSDGPKRQRQFRWYNQDGDNENGSFLHDIDGQSMKDDEEDEEDESWRKTRLERENFLRNQKNEDLEIPDENIKFVKLAKKKIVKQSPKLPAFTSPDPRKQFSLVSRRGSFLSRGEKLLSKLAEITNVSGDNPVGNLRGKRNMVFAVVSPPKEDTTEMSVKRKSSFDMPVSIAKKLKFTPPVNKSKGNLIEQLKMID